MRLNGCVGQVALATVCAMSLSCARQAPVPVPTAKPSELQLAALAGRSILLAHQSVGGNIIAGIERLTSGRLAITQLRAAGAAGVGLHHYYVGHNGDPLGKIADFAELFQHASEPTVDVALLKLCFVDFGPATDGAALASAYITTLKSLAAAHPHTRFVAVTAPLTAVNPRSPRSLLRQLLGRAPSGVEANLRRQEFNDRVRQAFTGADLFDLARLESTGLGALSGVAYQGHMVETLDARLSSDGGHLNQLGQDLAATRLLQVIAAGLPAG